MTLGSIRGFEDGVIVGLDDGRNGSPTVGIKEDSEDVNIGNSSGVPVDADIDSEIDEKGLEDPDVFKNTEEWDILGSMEEGDGDKISE